MHHSVRLGRPVKAYDIRVNRMPAEYARNLLDDDEGPYPETPSQDEKHALATVKHYRSLVPMAQEARKPIFHLTPADGAIGSHAAAARDAYTDFKGPCRENNCSNQSPAAVSVTVLLVEAHYLPLGIF